MLMGDEYPDNPLPDEEEFFEDYEDYYFDGSAPKKGRVYIICLKRSCIMDKRDRLLLEMIDHDANDPWMIQHFIKVSQLARIIGLKEGLSESEMEMLEVAGLIHDIGIKPSREKYGDASGEHQEQEGPSYAKVLLEKIGYDQGIVDRVCYLVGNHHTYSDIDGQDYQILVEADFLVNLYENNMDLAAKENTYHQIFRTESGKELFVNMFGL